MLIKSEDISELAMALHAFQSKAPSIGLDAKNPFFKSDYATLANIVKTSAPILAECKLAVTQLLCGAGGVTTILLHISGQYIGDSVELPAAKDDPQGHGSAITYARRYGYASILGLVPDKDDDANAASGRTPPKKAKATKAADSPDLAAGKARLMVRAKNTLIRLGVSEPTDRQAVGMITSAAKVAKQTLPLKTVEAVDKTAVCLEELDESHILKESEV